MPILTLAAKDLRLLLRDPRSAVILLLTPLLLILVLGLALGEGFGEKPDERLRISIVNLDRGLPGDVPFPDKPWSEVVALMRLTPRAAHAAATRASAGPTSSTNNA